MKSFLGNFPLHWLLAEEFYNMYIYQIKHGAVLSNKTRCSSVIKPCNKNDITLV